MNHLHFDAKKRIKQEILATRRRAVRRYRLLNLLHTPGKLLVLLPVLAVALVLWQYRNAVIPKEISADLAELYQFVVPMVIVVLAAVFAFAVLDIAAVPRHAKRYERALFAANLTTCETIAPALLSRRHIKGSSIHVLTFYSIGVSCEYWLKNQSAAEDALNVTFIEPPTYGGRKGMNRNLIVLTVTDGVNERRKEPLLDDEL